MAVSREHEMGTQHNTATHHLHVRLAEDMRNTLAVKTDNHLLQLREPGALDELKLLHDVSLYDAV